MADTLTWNVNNPVAPTPVVPTAPPLTGALDTNLDDLIRLPINHGSVFINGKSSYSGVDIKVVVHVYDGGKLANERRNFLAQDINNLELQLRSATAERGNLEAQVFSSNNFTSGQVNHLNSLNQRVVILQNSLDALNDEHARLLALNPQFSTKVLAEIQTLSLSSHREKFPVRALGSTYPKGFTRGPRTIAGTMIFTVFDTNVLEQFLESHPADFDMHNSTSTAIIDQIPPFDITVAFANELGQVSRMAIYGVEIVNEGQTMSIEDMFMENVVQFVAQDYDPMRVVGARVIDENNRMTGNATPLKASALIDEADYQEYKDKLNPFDRFKRRVDPFS